MITISNDNSQDTELQIKFANAEYTGGGVYFFFGEFTNGLYFFTTSEDIGWNIFNTKPYKNNDTIREEALYANWYDRHVIKNILPSDSQFQIMTDNYLNWMYEHKPAGNYAEGELKHYLDYLKIT